MNELIIKKFWKLFNLQEFDAAGKLMDSEAVVMFPNTREIFKGRDKYIFFNKRYQGCWSISLEKIISKEEMVITVVKVESDEKFNSFYATSFFILKDNLIMEITEYWGDNGEPPKWRSDEALSERY